MNTDTIIRRLDELGVSMQVNGDRLQLRPGSIVPEELQQEIKTHKIDLVDRLSIGPEARSEMTELLSQVREQGFVLLWSNVLQDTVAFVRDAAMIDRIPNSFTIYNVDELSVLFREPQPSEADLRRIHQVKKYGGRIVDEL